jgi:hypothetical protein
VPGVLFVQYFSLVVEADGALYATNVTTMTVSLNSAGNQFTGSYTTDQLIGGQTKLISSGTVSGTLIPRNPLP